MGEALFNERAVSRIIREGTTPYRSALNKSNLHILELSYNALKASDPKLTQEEYQQLLGELKKVYPVESSLKTAVYSVKSADTAATYSVFVHDRKYGTYLVGGSYTNLQKGLGPILKNIGSLSVFTEVNVAGQTRSNIGHIVSDMLPSTQSPLGNQLLDLAHTTSKSNISEVFLKMYSDLEIAHDAVNIEYEFTRPDFDTDGFNKILGNYSILVTLQGFAKNNELAVGTEKRIANSLRDMLITNSLLEKLVNKPGSRSIVEDIELSVVSNIAGKKVTSKHTKHTNKTTQKIPNKPTKPIVDRLPPIRNLQGQFFSLISLQALINASLQHVISANMGNEPYPGGQRKILNYRTGRFASSATVERISQSRQGMITAFYTYMKYPYQTFEPGFAQGVPLSRDPKLLISKSIREIAATKVSNKLRAVAI